MTSAGSTIAEVAERTGPLCPLEVKQRHRRFRPLTPP
jgi:hypothetical protein